MTTRSQRQVHRGCSGIKQLPGWSLVGEYGHALVEKLGEEVGGNYVRYCVDIWGQRPVFADLCGFCAHGVVGLFRQRSCLQRREQIDALASAKKFDGENVLKITQHS